MNPILFVINLRLMFFYVWHGEQFVPGVPALVGFELRQESCDLRNSRIGHNMRKIVMVICVLCRNL